MIVFINGAALETLKRMALALERIATSMETIPQEEVTDVSWTVGQPEQEN